MVQKFLEVNQFHSGLALGDAVTGDMLEMQSVLRDAGYSSRIFGEHIGAGLEGRVEAVANYLGNSASLLIVHHSMGFDCMDHVVGLPDRKILKYHNITPPEFLPNEYLKRYSIKGRDQLAEYRNHVEMAFGDSEYNRAELEELGYRYTGVLPIFFQPSALRDEVPSETVERKLRNHFNLLFVGRIAPNKSQIDLVRIFDEYYRSGNPDARLHLIGSFEGFAEYHEALLAEIKQHKLSEVVSVPGKVSAGDLAAYYRYCQVLLCASEHEGFCVPLLEAMAFELPVVAYAQAAVPETMGRAGALLDSKAPRPWCQVLEELRKNADFRQGLLASQRQRLHELDASHNATTLLEAVRGLENTAVIDVTKPTLQVQGPFETSYSLAVVNRNLTLALDQTSPFDASIYCTEGPGDYKPKPEDLADKPAANWLWRKSSLLISTPDITIRNLYPPRVKDVNGRLNFLHFFWEDSLVPPEWVDDFNLHLDGILAPSSHVQSVLLKSGVNVPVHVIGTAVDERFFAAATPVARDRRNRPFTFLNISSGFPRKGIDVLLAAYFQEFTAADNVRLVLKTFPNPHNTIAEQLAAWRKRVRNPPECVHIDRDLSAEEIDHLYEEADCLAYPTRAEGFGLPVAEAMAQRLPVIVTGYSGHTDFASDETAFLVGYRLVASESHFGVPGAEWAEPNLNDLRKHMRFVHGNPGSHEVRQRVEAAYANVSTNLRWPKIAERTSQAIANTKPQPAQHLAMVTSWDERCGIAEYSRYLINSLKRNNRRLYVEVLSPPGEGVWEEQEVGHSVCWNQRPHKDLATLRNYILSSDIEIVHFQFNFGFFDLNELAYTIDELKRDGKRVIITFHATADLHEGGKLISLKQIADALRRADLLLVHSASDEWRLASFGVTRNVKIIPHGNLVFQQEDRSLRKQWGVTLNPVLGTFGFLLPHKGILELLEAVAMLRREFPNLGLLAQCALHRNPISMEFERTVRERIAELGLENCVLLSTEFLPPEEAALFLQLSDLIVLAYGSTAESSSAAVRFALGAQRPVITTAGAIFADVAGSTLQIESNSPQSIATAVRNVLTDVSLAERLARKAQAFVEETSWDKVSFAYTGLLNSLTSSAKTPVDKQGKSSEVRLCELTNPYKWTNPDWMKIHRELETYAIDKHVFADQPEMGHRKGWEWTQTLYGLERLGAIKPDAKALGVGAGHEPLLFYFADRLGSVVGTDLYGNEGWSQTGGKEGDRTAVENPAVYCSRDYKQSRLQIMEMDGTRLEFEDESFDIVWSLSSIEHFGGHEKARQAIREMARVTKPGGYVVVATEFVISSSNGKHPEYFDREDWERYILSASGDLQLLEPMDYTLPPTPWLLEPINVNTNDVHRIRRHVILEDGAHRWTSGIAFFQRKPKNVRA